MKESKDGSGNAGFPTPSEVGNLTREEAESLLEPYKVVLNTLRKEAAKKQRRESQKKYEEKRRETSRALTVRLSDADTVKSARQLIEATIAYAKARGFTTKEVMEKYTTLIVSGKDKVGKPAKGASEADERV